ncbi:hypothetical protein RRG08_039775 [Elysia crispata]|uniref:Uncharacterized protein n=1 Tax=Elysia crispata TaxID=231223 RepID=A0AAE0ZTX1_9GAST|nr:hypothetical protein RRG08_039775 [Elysia crispata]
MTQPTKPTRACDIKVSPKSTLLPTVSNLAGADVQQLMHNSDQEVMQLSDTPRDVRIIDITCLFNLSRRQRIPHPNLFHGGVVVNITMLPGFLGLAEARQNYENVKF